MARIKKKARREGRTIVFIDESGVSLEPTLRRTWAPKGHPTVVRHHWAGTRQKLSIIAAVTPREFYFQIHTQHIRSGQVVEFLKHLRLQIADPLLVIWDGGSMHRGRPVKEYLAQQNGTVWVERMPAYAPELNPVEYAWGQLKQQELPNLVVESLPVLRRHARKGLRRIQRRLTLIESFWKQAELPL